MKKLLDFDLRTDNLQMIRQRNSSITFINNILLIIMIVSIIIEMIFFPSFENTSGCLMMVFSYFCFVKLVFKCNFIVSYPLSFVLIMIMFLYRYLPLVGTLLSFKPVSYGMATPVATFILESLLFFVICCSFRLACRNITKINLLQKVHLFFGIYKELKDGNIWFIGFVGVLFKLLTYSSGNIASNGIGNALISFMYMPVLLFFPSLYKQNYSKPLEFRNIFLWLYVIFITFLNLGSNSRGSLITPYAMIALLSLIYIFKGNINLRKFVISKKAVIIVIMAFFLLSFIGKVSDAMLSVRNIRGDVSVERLIVLTIDNLNTNSITNISNGVSNTASNYNFGWTEVYIDNFILNRFANIRISDESLYVVNHLSEETLTQSYEDLINRTISIIPSKVLSMFDSTSKDVIKYSRGDYIYYLSSMGNLYSLGGYRVFSILADGFATFNILCYPCLFILYFLVFKMLNGFCYFKNGNVVYSSVGLLNIYFSLLIGCNGGGVSTLIVYILRGYWETIILFIIMRYISSAFINNNRT